VSHRCSGALSQGTTAVVAGAEEARYQAVGSVVVGAVAAGSGREAVHSAVAVLLVEEGSAVAAVAVAAREETREEGGMLDRLVEAQNTAVDRVVGLLSISVMCGCCQCRDGVPYPPFSGGATECQHSVVNKTMHGAHEGKSFHLVVDFRILTLCLGSLNRPSSCCVLGRPARTVYL
jgi:hypothetical protein